MPSMERQKASVHWNTVQSQVQVTGIGLCPWILSPLGYGIPSTDAFCFAPPSRVMAIYLVGLFNLKVTNHADLLLRACLITPITVMLLRQGR